jgi:5'-nucleotidase
MINFRTRAASYLLPIMLIFICSSLFPAEKSDTWPKRVLITNDNGIEDIKIIELAKAFSQIAETYVVAPSEDRSGSAHYLTATRLGKLTVRPLKIGENITAYAVDGFPADCVVLALLGIMRDNPPDLVISGINGGANLGADWMFSGTVGAARVAAFAGFPAIAVSGLDKSIPGSLNKASQWVVKLAQSRIIQELKPPSYITVSMPRISPGKIRGIQVAERGGIEEIPEFSKTATASGKGKTETWTITGTIPNPAPPVPSSDISLCDQGFIVIVPMIADEHDYKLLKRLKLCPERIPEWK